jgi:hypothetical protein
MVVKPWVRAEMGLTGLGVAGQAGAFDPEPIDIGQVIAEIRYDPNA